MKKLSLFCLGTGDIVNFELKYEDVRNSKFVQMTLAGSLQLPENYFDYASTQYPAQNLWVITRGNGGFFKTIQNAFINKQNANINIESNSYDIIQGQC